MSDAKPLEDILVNERYWLGWGRTAIDAALTTRATAAEKLVSSIGWFWTAYTSIALVGVALTDRDISDARAVLIFIPTAILIVAYLFGSLALLPPNIDFDPVRPRDLERAYNEALNARKSRLRNAAILTIIAAVAVIIAGIAVATANPDTEQTFAAVTNTDKRGSTIEVAGHFPDKQKVLVTVTATKSDNTASKLLLANSSGDLSGSIPAPDSADGKYSVTATWTEDSIERTETIKLSD